MTRHPLLCTMLTLCLLLFYPTDAAAAQELPPGFIIVDSDGISARADGSYFIRADELRPGDVLHKTVAIQNNTADKVFLLYLKTQALSREGNVNLFEEVEITISYAGQELFRGSADGSGSVNLREDVFLNRYKPGQMEEMELHIRFLRTEMQPGDYGRATFAFTFTAVTDEAYIPPNTGVDAQTLLYGIIIILGTACVFMFVKRKIA